MYSVAYDYGQMLVPGKQLYAHRREQINVLPSPGAVVSAMPTDKIVRTAVNQRLFFIMISYDAGLALGGNETYTRRLLRKTLRSPSRCRNNVRETFICFQFWKTRQRTSNSFPRAISYGWYWSYVHYIRKEFVWRDDASCFTVKCARQSASRRQCI